MSTESKVIKLSEEAHNKVRKVLIRRLSEGQQHIRWKDVASDLIIKGFDQVESIESHNDLESKTVDFLLEQIDILNDDERHNANLYSHIIYWDHIRLALAKGYSWKEAPSHVFKYLTSQDKKDTVVQLLLNHLSSLKEWR